MIRKQYVLGALQMDQEVDKKLVLLAKGKMRPREEGKERKEGREGKRNGTRPLLSLPSSLQWALSWSRDLRDPVRRGGEKKEGKVERRYRALEGSSRAAT